MYEQVFAGIIKGDLNGPLTVKPWAPYLGLSEDESEILINMLVREGVVVRDTQGNPFVRQVSKQEYIDAIARRAKLEARAGKLAARGIPKEHLAPIRERLEAAGSQPLPALERWHLDEDVHNLIGDWCRKPEMSAELRALRTTIRLYKPPNLRFEAYQDREQHLKIVAEQHLEIVDALEMRDGARAAKVISKHVWNNFKNKVTPD